ncbi:tetratricopeptide repeat protein [Burkholderia multivorans]|nr:hypothetical protein [Burkholderia multivorans]MBU9146045.1 hypothetical protein [Burkholderia multivorans]MBU9516751.1 hypothetical protein [Burkholderia multivorans]MBU9528775.1 hypothetical protein [Burkholderia multivorans]MBU9540865.1 hypothetical protein [Burkholderia multivorans]MBU9639938.1 hypothetical protein [Burkholderia multivorans]
MNQPLRAASEAVNQLMWLAAHAQKNDFSAKRCERELWKELERGVTPPAYLWLGLAAAAVVLGQHEECVRRIKAALDLSNDNFQILATAASLYSDVGELRPVEAVLEKLSPLVLPNDHDSIESMCLLLHRTLNYERALEMIKKTGFAEDSELAQATNRFLALTEQYNVTLDKRRRLIEVAIGAVRAAKYAIHKTALDQDCGEYGVRFEIFIDETAERCGEVNRAIADTLCEEFDDPVPHVVTFACRPTSSYVFEGHFAKVRL